MPNQGLPEGWNVENAIGGGDCFFDAIAKGLNNKKFTVKSLRKDLKSTILSNQELQNEIKNLVIKDARNTNDPSVRLPAGVSDNDLWNAYLASIEYTSNDIDQMKNDNPLLYGSLTDSKYGSTLQVPIWGRPDIEGKILCKLYGIKLHVIEIHKVKEEEVWINQIMDKTGSISTSDLDYDDPNTVHIINKGRAHFEPVIKTDTKEVTAEETRKVGEEKGSKSPNETNTKKQTSQSTQETTKVQKAVIAEETRKVGGKKGKKTPSEANTKKQASQSTKETIKVVPVADSSKGAVSEAKQLREQFFSAIRESEKDKVKSILEKLDDKQKKDLVEQDKNYNIPIIIAAEKGNLEIVKLLAENGADINAQDTYSKSTALHRAIENRHYDVAKYIVGIESVNLGLRDRDRNTAIILAAQKGAWEIVKLLAENGADVNAKNEIDITAIILAAKTGKWEIVKLLAEKGAYLEPYNKNFFTPIVDAALAGKWAIVMLLAEKGAYLESCDEKGDTPIIRASKERKLGTVKLLVEKGADINAKNKAGNAAIMYAALAGNLKMVKLLLEHGANPSITDKSDRTPSDIAILFDRSEVAKFIIRHLIRNPEAVRPYYITRKYLTYWNKCKTKNKLLFNAVKKGDLDGIKEAINSGADVNAANEYGRTPLHIAALNQNDNKEIAGLLLENGAYINAVDKDGKTPLKLAEESGNKDIVSLLEEAEQKQPNKKLENLSAESTSQQAAPPTSARPVAGSSKDAVSEAKQLSKEELREQFFNAIRESEKDKVKSILEDFDDEQKKEFINAIGKYSKIPLHYAVELGNAEVVRLLLEYGANPNIGNYYNRTPLHLAIEKGHFEIVEALLAIEGIDVNAADNSNMTPLHFAVTKGYFKIVEALLAIGGIDVNAADKVGMTPLHYAVELGNAEVVRLLLEYGASPNIGNYYNRTPLHLAIEKGHFEIVEALLAIEGIDVNATDKVDMTPLHYAVTQGNFEVTKLLVAKGTNLKSCDLYDNTPLDIARKKSHADIASLLEKAAPNTDFTGLTEPQQVSPPTSAGLRR